MSTTTTSHPVLASPAHLTQRRASSQDAHVPVSQDASVDTSEDTSLDTSVDTRMDTSVDNSLDTSAPALASAMPNMHESILQAVQAKEADASTKRAEAMASSLAVALETAGTARLAATNAKVRLSPSQHGHNATGASISPVGSSSAAGGNSITVGGNGCAAGTADSSAAGGGNGNGAGTTLSGNGDRNNSSASAVERGEQGSSEASDQEILSSESITPFFEFSAQQWSTFAHKKNKLTLTEEELQKCLAFNDKISLEDVSNIYLPLSRLLYLYVHSRHNRSTVIKQFLGQSIESAPFIISISGSVACGKTTTANLLRHLISTWDTNPKVDLITTDGFLYPNAVLHERHIEAKKGFPISYDVKALMTFLDKLKNGTPNLKVPVYSHLYYDVMPGEYITIDRPDILILEGVNVLQNGADYPTIRNKVFISDFIDFSIYVDAEEDSLIKWYLERFLKLRESTFSNPHSYFHRYANMDVEDALNIATTIWSAVNHDNLIENILPSRNRANLILHKDANHTVDRIYLRK